MSWFNNWFSKPVKESIQSNHEHRLLEVESSKPEPIAEPLIPPAPSENERPERSKIILAAGTAFFAFSLLITRRAFVRRRLAANPAFYTNAPHHHAQQSAKVNGPLEAVEALSIATVNVLSLGMMATGGTLWYLGINSMADARKTLRGGLGVDGTGRSEQQAEEEFEEWMATVLSRKEAKETRSEILGKRGKDR